MRFPSAYYLMLLYLTIMFRGVIPVLEDDLSHSFADAEHIATVHMLYGDNHVEKAMADTGRDNDGSKPQNSVKTEDQVPVHIPTDALYTDFSISNANNLYTGLKLNNLPSIYLSTKAPPPKFS